MMKRFLFASIFWASSCLASLAGSGTIQILDGNGVLRTYDVITDGSGNYVGKNSLCDGAAAAQCAAVKAASTAAIATDPAVVVAVSPNNTVAISASALPLPSGAATQTTLASILTALGSPFQASGSIGNSGFNALQGGAANSATNPFFMAPATADNPWPISASSLPLPTGAATQTTLASILTNLGSPFQAGGNIGNTTFAATQSGTWNITNISGTISLPTGAATSALQSTGNTSLASILTDLTGGSQKSQIVDGSGNVIASTSNSLNVQCANCSGSGVSTADAATFTAGTSLFAGSGGEFTSGGATACVTGHQCIVGMTAARGFLTDTSSIAGIALGSPSNYGTSPGAVEVQGVNAFVTNTPAVTQSGTWNIGTVTTVTTVSAVTAISNALPAGTNKIGTFDPATITTWGLGAAGSAVPTNTQQIGGSDGTDLRAWLMSSTGQGHVICDSGCSGSGGTSITDNAAFTTGTTAETPIGCYAGTPSATANHSTIVACTTGGSVHTTVDNTNGNGQATMANSSPVVIASNQSAVPSNITQVAGATISATNPLFSNLSQGSAALSATNGIYSNILQGNAALSITNPSFARIVSGATGGASTAGAIVPNNTTAVVVKSSPGTLYGLQLYGINAAPLYVKFYNATSATCGSGTPVKRVMIPANGTAADGAGSNVSFGDVGVNFSTGITYCATTGIGDTDTTAPTANNYLINVDYL